MTKTNVRHHTMKSKFRLLVILAVLGFTAACSEGA